MEWGEREEATQIQDSIVPESAQDRSLDRLTQEGTLIAQGRIVRSVVSNAKA